MISARPNVIPQYTNNYGADFPRAEAMKFKIPHERYQHQVKRQKVTFTPANPLATLGQRNQLDQSLPSMQTPFELRHTLSKLGGISGFYGSSTQNGKPLSVQKGLGTDNMEPREPLKNSNF
jgi:hypothetical protein